MAVTPSTMLKLGTQAPHFSLPDTGGKPVSLSDFSGSPGLLVMFICNHCPFVKHLQQGLVEFAREYQQKGLSVVAISSNDTSSHPQDGPQKMAEEAASAGYTFPYLYDETQEVARAYRASCTPDLFLFDAEGRLVYRGRFDDSTPGNNVPVTGKELRTATDALLSGKQPPPEQHPSIGCNIKWKSGNEPDYFSAKR